MLDVFRKIAFLEGLSFIVLLCVAMPLKYVWGMPQAVRIVGSLHGLLFVLYVGVMLVVWKQRAWKLSTGVLAFVAAFVPFGPFLFDRRLLQDN